MYSYYYVQAIAQHSTPHHTISYHNNNNNNKYVSSYQAQPADQREGGYTYTVFNINNNDKYRFFLSDTVSLPIGGMATPTQHNIEYGIKVSQVVLSHSVFPTTPTLNNTITKAAQSLQSF